MELLWEEGKTFFCVTSYSAVDSFAELGENINDFGAVVIESFWRDDSLNYQIKAEHFKEMSITTLYLKTIFAKIDHKKNKNKGWIRRIGKLV